MQTTGIVFEYLIVAVIVLACAAYWGRRLLPRRETAMIAADPGGTRPGSCGGCRNCDGGGCH